MADEPIADVNQTPTDPKANDAAVTKPKARTPRNKADAKPAKVNASSGLKPAQSSKITAKASKASSVATDASTRKVKKYTPAERSAILASIEKATKDGKTTVKAALQQANVGEQTYYNWKNAAEKTRPTATSSAGDDLTTLVALEAENISLRKELAAKLRAENAELRKRLGME